MPILKLRRNQSSPLSCEDMDQNWEATLERQNHTGTQLASTISNLYTTVEGYDFITALQTCCEDLTTQLEELQDSIFGDGEIATLINNLRNELLQDIAEVQTDLNALTLRVTTAENTIATFNTTFTSLSNSINGLSTSKANIANPTFTGVPKAPIPSYGADPTQIATVGYVNTIFSPIGGNSFVDKVCTAGEVLEAGVYYFKDFTVPNTITLSNPVVVEGTIKIYCSGNVNINGVIKVNSLAEGGEAIFVNDSTKMFTQPLNYGFGLGNKKKRYSWQIQQYGSAGASGAFVSYLNTGGNNPVFAAKGGNGGGSFILQAAGPVKIANTGKILVDGDNGEAGSTKAIEDENTGLIIIEHGEIGDGIASIFGSGGGSGGLIYLSSVISVTVRGDLSAKGGQGGDALQSPKNKPLTEVSPASGGHGGSGGYIVLVSNSIDTVGSDLNVTPGSRGVDLIDGYAGYIKPSINIVKGSDSVFGLLNSGYGGGYGGYGGGNWIATKKVSPNITEYVADLATAGQVIFINQYPTLV